MELCKIFNPETRLKTFGEMKYGDKYYYLETETMRFSEAVWGKYWAIDIWQLHEKKAEKKPYTVQWYNSTRTIFGTSRLAILMCIYYKYLKTKR